MKTDNSISGKLIEQIKRHEGFRGFPYHCTANKLSIGYGRNLDANGISSSEAEMLLDNDLYRVEHELKRAWPHFAAMPESARKDVLINMAFNLGTRRLMTFKKTLEFVRLSEFDKAADEMLKSKWAVQVGNRAIELSGQMRSGKYAQDR
jgi:lysozyme